MSMFVVVVVLASIGLWAVLGGGTTPAQAAEISPSTMAADPNPWRSTLDDTNPAGASRKPVLYQLLADNNKIEAGNDELRMDFVLRVAHGEVDPTATSVDKLGLRIIYDYGNGKGAGDSYVPDYTFAMTYYKTMGSNNGGVQWARNNYQYFTIEKIVESGIYDYLTVSIQGDMNIPDESANGNDWWNYANKNGRVLQRYVFVAVGPYVNNSGDYSLFNVTTESMQSWNLAAEITSGRTVTAYPYTCLTDKRQPNPYAHGCAAPNAFVGWDGYPNLWSSNQANWGLNLDNPISGSNVSKLNSSANGLWGNFGSKVTFPEGTAPPDSFFVEWFDPASSGHNETNACFTHTSFKFQWFGLQNGTDWVPVTDLTPTAQEVDNQEPSWSSIPPTGWGVNITKLSALNSPNSADHNLMAKGDSADGLAPAQNADGSIDFAKAKRDQVNPQATGTPGDPKYKGLDGYFKLVTWPVMNPGCDVSSLTEDSDLSQLIPSPTNSANPTDVSSKVGDSQADIQRRIDTGWTLDTAFYKYDVPRPDAPTIDGFSNAADTTTANKPKAPKAITKGDADNFSLGDSKVTLKGDPDNLARSTPVIHGHGTPGDEISLFYDEPSAANGKVISKLNEQETDTQGTLVGKVTVGEDGTWQIADGTDVSTMPTTRRYHAYQTSQDGMQLSSDFTGIDVVHLSIQGNPSITDITSTPVVDGVMATDSTVVVSGVSTGGSVDSRVSMSVAVAGSNGATNPNAASCDPETIPALSSTEYTCTYTGDGANWFKDHDQDAGAKFVFTGKLADQAGGSSVSDPPTTEIVDFWAPKAGMDSIDRDGAHGKMQSTLAGNDSLNVDGGSVQLTWVSDTGETITSSPVDVHPDGSWLVKVPYGMSVGTVTAVATDAAGGTSAEESMRFQLGIPVTQLPFTGARGLKPLLIVLAASLVLAVAAGALSVVRVRRMQRRA